MTTGRINQVTSPYSRPQCTYIHTFLPRNIHTYTHRVFQTIRPTSPKVNQSLSTYIHVHKGHSRPMHFTHIVSNTQPYCPTSVVLLAFSLGIQITYTNNTFYINPFKDTYIYTSIPSEKGQNQIAHIFYTYIQQLYVYTQAAHWPGLLRIGLHTDTHSVTTQTIHAAVTRYNNL